MSFFDQYNKQADSPVASDSASTGPLLGFLGGMQAAYEAEARANSSFGIEKAMIDSYDQDFRKLYDAGERSFPPIIGASMGEIRALSGDGEFTPEMQSAAQDWQKLQAKYPQLELKTPEQRWQSVREAAQQAERRWNGSSTTFSGMVGGFIGGSAAGLNPVLNPLNVATLPIAGGGSSVAGRIAVQGGAQGATELVGQLTGVQGQRQALGLDAGIGQALQSAGAAALLGAGLQGAGEGLAYGLGRWFRGSVKDPAPPPPAPAAPQPVRRAGELGPEPYGPNVAVDLSTDLGEFLATTGAPHYGPTREAAGRHALDARNVIEQLDQWGGPAPWEIKPHTDTAPAPDVTTYTWGTPYRDAITQGIDIEGRARAIDPPVFSKVDKIEARMQELRAQIAAPMDSVANETQSVASTIEAQLAEVKANGRPVVTGKARKRLERELEALRNAPAEPGATNITRPAEQAAIDERNAPYRDELMKLDAEMRDLAPLVNRAMSQADNEWIAGGGFHPDTLAFFRRVEGRSIPFLSERNPLPFRWLAESKLRKIEPAPEIDPALRVGEYGAGRPDLTIPPGADPADRVAAVREADAKVDEAGSSMLLSELRAALKEPAAGEVPVSEFTLPNGRTISLNERIVVDDVQGEVTVRQFLQELSDDHEVLSAVTTCGRIS